MFFLSVSLHCFKCNSSVKLNRVICCGVAYRAVLITHFCLFFVWITCQDDFFLFVVFNKKKLVKGKLEGEHVQWRQKELQHCIVTYSQELNIMHTQSILYSDENNFQTTSTTFKKIKCKKVKRYLLTVIYEITLFK